MVKKISKAIIRTSVAPYEFINEIFTSNDHSWVSRLLEDSYFCTALNLASPELLVEAKKMLKNDKDEKETQKLRQSLLKYVIRMSSRSTPFGMFSGIGTLPLTEGGELNEIRIKSREKHQKSFKLDMGFSVQLAGELMKNPIIKKYAKYYVNTSLYKLGSSIRLITYALDQKSRIYDLLSVESNIYLEEILRLAKKGAFRNELIDWLVTEDIEKEEAEAYLDDLIENQLLISELEPSTIGPEMEYQLKAVLKKIHSRLKTEFEKNKIQSYIDYIDEVIGKLDHLNELENIELADYENTLSYILNESPVDLNSGQSDTKFIIQCNLSLNFEETASLSQSQEELVRKAIRVVNHFIPKRNDSNDTNLGKFKVAFLKRYEEKFIPLVEALDAETGIGYGLRENKELMDIGDFLSDIPVKMTEREFQQLNWHKKMFSFWLPKFNQAIENGCLSVELTDKELQEFEEVPTRYAASFSAKTSFYKKENEDVIAFEYYGGPTSTIWSGRFSNSDQGIKQLNQDIIDHEQNEANEALVAEINYLPESRLGNVIQRAQGRTYQINYLAGINSGGDFELPLEDLMIGVREGKFVLTSKKLKKEIRTYHSNAFNADMPSNMPVFQFLSDLTNEHHTAMGSLNFSAMHQIMKFVPRLTYQNIIFQRASWRFSKNDFEDLIHLKGDDLIKAFTRFRKKWLLPKQFVIKHTDNELLIDATHSDALSILLNTIKKSETIQLKEFLLYSHESIVKDEKGKNYSNEILVNYMMSSPKNDIALNLEDAVTSNVQDTFPPGSEWLYYKLYMGIKTADKFLVHVKPFLDELWGAGIIEKWFFIRYADPGQHLRLRLKVVDLNRLGEIILKMGSIFEAFQSEYPIEKIMMDTYQRELERYGYETIDVFESIFMYDSIMTAEIIEHCEIYDETEKIWLPTLYSMTTLLDIMEFEPDEKEHFTDWILQSFKNEFNAFSETTKSINKKYNAEKEIIHKLYLSEFNEGFLRFKDIVNKRNEAIKPLVGVVLKRYPSMPDRMRFLNSIIHMSVNRQFRAKQRFYEFVITDFMARITKTLRYIKTA